MPAQQQPTGRITPPDQIVPLASGCTWFIGLFTLALVTSLLLALVLLWPHAVEAANTIALEKGAAATTPAGTEPAATAPGEPPLTLLGITIPPGLQLMLLAMLMGGLGGSVHTSASFIVFVGNRQLARSWVWWYVLWPFIAMILAIVVYFVIRAGFLTFGSMPTKLNPYGIAAISALAGMFAKQTTEKLREIMNMILNVKAPTTLHDRPDGDGESRDEPGPDPANGDGGKRS